jgi:glycosyltransferase involved in cell wall biosynthesis
MQGRSVLIIVQNLPVPMDRRVWLECKALRDAGYDVAVICPKAPGDRRFEVLERISLYKYRAAPATTGFLSYFLEFAYCWIRTALLSVRVFGRHRFSVLQACNPPDTYWLLGAFWKLFGVSYVFDQHDLNPELFRSRFGEPSRLGSRAQFAVLCWLERMTYRVATRVIVTNESYRSIALQRGGLPERTVTVVRSGPDTTRMRPVPGRAELLKGARHLLAYVGIMGPQDNVDVLLDVMDVLVRQKRRTDLHLVLMGFGDCLESLRQQAHELGLDRYVTFTGRADQEMIADYLSTAHLGLAPDLKTPLNDISTHNKTMEYMAYALPIVSFDLVESRTSAGDSSLYVRSGDVVAFAEAVSDLLDDPERRARMSRTARTRCVAELDWEPQSRAYVGVFDELFGQPARDHVRTADRRSSSTAPAALPVLAGRTVIDLRDPRDFESFLHRRGLVESDELIQTRPRVATAPQDLPAPVQELQAQLQMQSRTQTGGDDSGPARSSGVGGP